MQHVKFSKKEAISTFYSQKTVGRYMKAICLFFSVSLCSWIGWELGASYGIMIAYWISFIGSLLGVFLGIFIYKRFLE